MAAPDERRGAIDVARVLALLVVVVGHLTIAVVDRDAAGELRGANLLTLLPGWAWLGALSPMPVFFAAGGWANATARPAATAPRLRLLVGLAAVVTLAWGGAVLVATLVAGGPGVLGQGARVSTQPLWFLAPYLPFAIAGGLLASFAARRPVVAIGGCLALLAAVDVARFALGAPEWLGWLGFYPAWAVPWLAGGWWRDRALRGTFAEGATGLRLLAAAVVVGALLVRYGGYHPSLIDVDPRARSNTTPPNLYTGVAAFAQAAALMAAATALDAWARRWRRLWDRLGDAAVAIYVWHLTALSLCAAVVAAGLPVPERLTAAWWLTRPVWWAAILAVTLVFVAATAPLRPVLGGPRGTPSRAPVLGVAVAAATAAFTGLRGPRSAAFALVCITGFVAARLLLGGSGRRAFGRRRQGAEPDAEHDQRRADDRP